MKKIIYSLFMAILAAGLIACSDPEQEDPTYSVTIGQSENGTVTADKNSGIKAGETVTLTAAPEDGYALALISSDGEAITFSGEENTRTFVMPKRNVTLTAAFRIEVQGKLGKFSSPYEICDIVFNDGSAIPYVQGLTLTTEQKAAAIALIFYKGNELNSGEDTTTVRTLGVALKHNKDGLARCTMSAQAYAGFTTTIGCSVSGLSGNLIFTGDKNGSDNLEAIAAYLTATKNKTDDTSTAANYPAFYFGINYSTTAVNLGTTYAGGWYLPSIAEIYQIYVNGKAANKKFDIDAASELCGGDIFGNSTYWTSSRSPSYSGGPYVFNVNNGGYGIWGDDSLWCVCCIREF